MFKLRVTVLLLVLMNAAYFSWSHGAFMGLGFAPEKQSEPERLRQQIRPDAMHLLTAQERQLLEVPPVGLRASECLQAGLFTEVQGAVLRNQLSANPALGIGELSAVVTPARWIVYMGKYGTAEELNKKRVQLAALSLQFEPLTNPMLEFGLSLGRYDTQAGANVALEGLTKRGVRTAHVVQEHAEIRGLMLRLKTAQFTTQAQLDTLMPALAGKVLGPCR
jgi:hypothetical protein